MSPAFDEPLDRDGRLFQLQGIEDQVLDLGAIIDHVPTAAPVRSPSR
jgi:hypothetical protein